jgi:hypothetical protein
LAVAAVDCHTFAKGGDLFGEGGVGFGAETIYPELERVLRRGE